MKILCFTDAKEDYLADAVLIGLKQLYGAQVLEYPAKPILYQGADLSKVRGNGFTLYGLLPSQSQVVVDDLDKLNLGDYDWIIFTSIWRQYPIFLKLYTQLNPHKTIILDGEDKQNLFLCAWKFWKKPKYWFSPKPYKGFLYFKRELTPKTYESYFYKLIPFSLLEKWGIKPSYETIQFGFPSEKITNALPIKTKVFPGHIVDQEVKEKVQDAGTGYVFSKEADYYDDLKAAKFGITMKRGGWDCLRHYEIAANAAVICFKQLDLKPTTCAPHGLIPNVNCIQYQNYDDLMHQIEGMTENQYLALQSASLRWVKECTCDSIAQRLLNRAGNLVQSIKGQF
jgi:hypothetical protein